MTHNEMVEMHYKKYSELYGDDLAAVLHECKMVEGSPDDHFDGGADEKEAILFALWFCEEDIRDRFEG